MKQNEIKVFEVGSKKLDYRILHFSAETVARKLGQMVGKEAQDKATTAFQALQRLDGGSLSFRCSGRKIKVELAEAA